MFNLAIILLSLMNSESADSNNNRIAKYILEHIDELENVSISDLARKCYVSNSSISRFCRAIGLQDYNELRNQVAKYQVEHPYTVAHKFRYPGEDADEPYSAYVDQIIANPKMLLNFGDGFVVYGGIIAGIGVSAIYCHKKKLPFLRYLDCAAPSIALAQGFGRIGCFLAGCCYGVKMDSPISITFTHSDFAPNNVPLFPSQLVSSAFDFLNFALLCVLLKRNDKPGRIGAFYLIFYSIGRFIIEFFRGDLERGSVGSLSTSQFISIFVMIAGIAMVVLLNRKKSTDNHQ